LKKELFHFDLLIGEVYKQMKSRALRNHINFSLEMENGSIHMNGDRNRLKQVFINVLDNAFKFTDANGDILIVVKPAKTFVTIVIQDSGKGIPGDEHDQLLTKFFKGNNQTRGIGLGLAICKEI